MAGFTPEQIEEIKARIDLSELIASYGVQVKRMGASLKACCPFHHEKTPSFHINTMKGFYHCFGCGESGDAIKFVQKQEGLTFVEAVKKLAEQAGVKLELKEDPEAGRRNRLYALMTEAAAFYHRCLGKIKEAEPAREYLKTRALNEEVQEKYLIGYAPKGYAVIKKWAEKYGFTHDEVEAAGIVKEDYHRFGGRLMFTICDKSGRPVAFSGRQIVEDKHSGKYVNSPETLIFKKSRTLFGLDKAAGPIAKHPKREVIICEGQIDCIRLHMNGFTNAVASQGTAFTEEHAAILKRVADSAILCFDDDGAGHKATIRTAGILLKADIPVKCVSLPDGDDPDSFLRTKGAAAFRQMMANKHESVVAFMWRSLNGPCRGGEVENRDIGEIRGVVGAILAVIAGASNAVVRSVMIGELARVSKVPVKALEEELTKVQRGLGPGAPGSSSAGSLAEGEDFELDDEVEIVEETAPDYVGPNVPEKELVETLVNNPDDEMVKEMVREFVPAKMLASESVVNFVAAYLDGKVDEWVKNMKPWERRWYQPLMLNAGLADSSTLTTAQLMQQKVRALWQDYINRLRFNTDDVVKQMQYSVASKNMKTWRWPKFKEFVKGLGRATP